MLVRGRRTTASARAKYAHLHLSDIAEGAALFQNERIVLKHFSLRYRPAEIRKALDALPAGVSDRVVPFLPRPAARRWPVPPPV